jgi:hypothetical protein
MKAATDHTAVSAALSYGAAARAEQILRQSTYPALWIVSCQQTGGAMVLHGRVPLFYLKQLAQMLVAKTINGGQILNQIEVANR